MHNKLVLMFFVITGFVLAWLCSLGHYDSNSGLSPIYRACRTISREYNKSDVDVPNK